MVSESGAQHGGYMASKLWVELEKDTSDKQPLIQVSTWTIGEFGDMLLQQSDDHAVAVRTAIYFIFSNIYLYQMLFVKPFLIFNFYCY